MKRFGIWFVVMMALIGSALLLKIPVRNPSDFTGKWYFSEDGAAYLFHNGIIINEKYHFSETEQEIFSGAYSFGKDCIVLFYFTADGVEQVRELRLVRHNTGDTLCEVSETGNSVVFRRAK